LRRNGLRKNDLRNDLRRNGLRRYDLKRNGLRRNGLRIIGLRRELGEEDLTIGHVVGSTIQTHQLTSRGPQEY